MTTTLVVILGNVIAGKVTRLAGGRLRFDYDETYRSRPDATPLSVSMPVQIPSQPDRVIKPWLWGLLPDNDAVLARWSRRFQVSTSSPLALLATPIGRDCAGAVRFANPDQVEAALNRPGRIDWLTEDMVGERLRELKDDSTAWLGGNFSGQFSLAGAQSKTALLFRDGHWGVPSGATPTTHILKPTIAGFDDHDLNEHLCLAAARRAGLVAVRTRVSVFGTTSAVVVERYDRRATGRHVRRIHQEDICQALSVAPWGKYQNEGGPGPGDIADLMRRLMAPSAADDSIWRFADALIWNWLVAGTDAHAKNYSLLLAGDQVRLAPLYDISSALPYGTHERKLRMAMKIGGAYGIAPRRNAWPLTARDLGLPAAELVDRVHELAALIPDAFADAARSPDVTTLGRTLPSKLVDLVAERASQCSRAAGPASVRE
ncbi:MAG: type II toxin-antitoxin system HipA family toxin [Streptosporangiaceae bacterium]